MTNSVLGASTQYSGRENIDPWPQFNYTFQLNPL